jgi:hypothetical protein
MRRRVWKYVGLVAAGGVLLQATGCAGAIVELLVSNLGPIIIQQVLAGALGGTT